jgi:hypothetical protein
VAVGTTIFDDIFLLRDNEGQLERGILNPDWYKKIPGVQGMADGSWGGNIFCPNFCPQIEPIKNSQIPPEELLEGGFNTQLRDADVCEITDSYQPGNYRSTTCNFPPKINLNIFYGEKSVINPE